MTHTPEPWKFYNAYGSKQVMFTRLGNDDDTILEAARCGIECVLSNAEDAYLIAAAPDLLEACQNLIEYRDHHTLNFQLEKADDFIHQIRVAIAKAKGLVEREVSNV